MLFQHGTSALVRLSDCIKLGVHTSLTTAAEWIAINETHAAKLASIREISKRALKGDVPFDQADQAMRSTENQIPFDEACHAVALQGQLHSQVLSVVLNICFALESYINAFAYHLHVERESANGTSASVTLEVFDEQSTLSKWEAIGRWTSATGFDASRRPMQDMKILFRFRDDLVHDKVVPYSSNRPKKRYGSRLPDPVFGFLSMPHLVYACDCYWAMICEVHKLTGVGREAFHRHYNLSPWFSSDFERDARSAAAKCCQIEKTG